MELSERLPLVGRCFGALKENTFSLVILELKQKNALFRATVLPTLLYGSSSWAVA